MTQTCPKTIAPPAPIWNWRAAAGSLLFTFQPLLLSAVMLPATAYVIRTLGANAYGEWMTASTLVASMLFLGNLGLRGPFVRAVAAEPESAEALLAQQVGIRLALALLAALAALGACVVLGYSTLVLVCTILSALAMLVGTVAATLFDLLQGLQRLVAVAALTAASGIVLTAGAVFAAWQGAGPVGVAVAYVSGPIVASALAVWLVRQAQISVRVEWKSRRVAQLLWGARYFTMQQCIGTASQYVTALAVTKTLGEPTFGYFAAGTVLLDRFGGIADGLGSAAYAAVARAGRGGMRDALRVTAYYLLLAQALCIPLTLLIVLLAGPISSLLFPRHPEVCLYVMRLTIWALPLVALECILGYALNALHRDALQAWASLISTLHIALALVLVAQFGLAGACWALVLRPVVRLAAVIPCAVYAFRSSWRQEAALKGVGT